MGRCASEPTPASIGMCQPLPAAGGHRHRQRLPGSLQGGPAGPTTYLTHRGMKSRQVRVSAAGDRAEEAAMLRALLNKIDAGEIDAWVPTARCRIPATRPGSGARVRSED